MYTYDVYWELSDISWASRWDAYLRMPGGRVHWFSILNSLMVVLVMSSIVAMIMMRTIRRDLARYEGLIKEDAISGQQLDTQRALVDQSIRNVHIKTAGGSAAIGSLSGGNQQKVVIAKSLVQDPSIVIFDEPTRGVDVGTIPEIHAQIRALADEGKAVVVISSYLPEVLSISDRILVARLGRIVAEFDAAAATEEKIMYAAIH